VLLLAAMFLDVVAPVPLINTMQTGMRSGGMY
jgi:hypothetical protein